VPLNLSRSTEPLDTGHCSQIGVKPKGPVLPPVGKFGHVTPKSATHNGSPEKFEDPTLLFQKPRELTIWAINKFFYSIANAIWFPAVFAAPFRYQPPDVKACFGGREIKPNNGEAYEDFLERAKCLGFQASSVLSSVSPSILSVFARRRRLDTAIDAGSTTWLSMPLALSSLIRRGFSQAI
jgi:hypothetical protein